MEDFRAVSILINEDDTDFSTVSTGVRHGRGPIRLVSRFDPTTENARIAFAIPRSVGNAVVRNRVRRRVRGLLSRYGGRIKAGYQLVIIGRYKAPDAEHGELEADWLQLLRRAGILEKEEGVEG